MSRAKTNRVTIDEQYIRDFLNKLKKDELNNLRKLLESMPKEETLEDLLLHFTDLKKQRIEINLKLKEYKESKKNLDRTISYIRRLDFKGLHSSPLGVVMEKQSEVCRRIRLHVSKLTVINSDIDKLKSKINHLFTKKRTSK